MTQSHDAYRWLCGSVQVNYHTLSDVRVDHGDTLDALLTDSVAALLAAQAVQLKRVAQDGMRVRTSAGAASFRRRGTLEQPLEDAREQVQTLKQPIDADPGALTRKQQAAHTRAARERDEKVQKALARLPELEAIKVRQGKPPEAARASTTDDQATVMKMADGGYQPADNAQFATGTESQVIVGVEVVTTGSDLAQLEPNGQTPEEWLVDGGFPAHEPLDAVPSRPPSTPRCPSRKTLRSIRMLPSPRTVLRWPTGGSAWALTRPR